MNKINSDIQVRTFEFAIEILKFCKKLQEVNKEYILSNQLMRSGTSIGANISEGKNGLSKADFVHKFFIS